MMRTLSYVASIREAHAQLLESDPRVFLIGQGLWSPWYAGGSLQDLDKQFGRSRVLDSPTSENAVTGAAVGAAIAGMRPIVFHPRMDFMITALDPIINQAANWSYLFGGQVHAPVVIRGVINRGGQQGAQHSQALQAIFMHIPGLKVVMPSTPYDAKGLLISAVNDGNPVIYIDDRWLYSELGDVPEEMYSVPIGEGRIVRQGIDATVVATSHMVVNALRAADALCHSGVEVEVIDLRSIKPWDEHLVFESVAKTGRLIVADGGWATCGIASEITSVVASTMLTELRAPISQVTLPDLPAPVSASLEQSYYPDPTSIVVAVNKALQYHAQSRIHDVQCSTQHFVAT